MTANEYQRLALRTLNKRDHESMLVNGALGLCGESGEVADLIKKHKFQGHPLAREKLIEELGDVAWYLAIMARALGCDLDDLLQGNVDKLRRRYPDGFAVDKSVHRDEE